MRAWILLTLAVCSALADEVPEVSTKLRDADKIMIQRQINIVRLFRYINQPSFFDDFVKVGRSYNPEQKELYSVPTVVDEFFWYYRNNFIQPNEVFSLSNDEHLQQAIALFRMFFYAKDYDTFFDLAIWARQNINKYMFVYSFSVALLYRPDAKGLVLPPIYEIFPQYFFSSDVIEQAQMYKQLYNQQGSQYAQSYPNGQYRQLQYAQKQAIQRQYQESSDEEEQTEYPEGPYPQEQYHQKQYHQGQYSEEQSKYARYFQQSAEFNNNGYTIISNYSNKNPMSYYLDDIELNSHHYYFNLYYPFWMNAEEYNIKVDRPDIVWYSVNKYLLSRYYNERLSNGLGEIPNLNWDKNVNQDFEDLPEFEMMNVTYSYGDLMDWARRIKDAIDLGYVYSASGDKIEIYTRPGFDLLSSIIRGSSNSPNYRFYGSIFNLAKYLLGNSGNGNQHQYKMPVPSVLDQFEPSLRDPVYYQMTKWIMQYFQRYLRNLPRYTKEDLLFNGVEIRNVQVDRLITYFDYSYTDLSNAVYYSPQERPQNFNVRVRQQRLNHKPFTFTLNVYSNSSGNAMVKVYMGPKYDQYGQQVQLSNTNWYTIDKFPVKLQYGENTIHRNNKDYFFWTSDRISSRQLYTYAANAVNGGEIFQMDERRANWGFPSRFVLPRGSSSGQKYQMYFFITPTNQTANEYSTLQRPEALRKLMSSPTGFPFDRYSSESAYRVPNAYLKDVVIINKNNEDF